MTCCQTSPLKLLHCEDYHSGSRHRVLSLCAQPQREPESSAASHSLPEATERSSQQEWCIVNFYHLVDIPDATKLVEEHKAWLQQQGLSVQGRIYYSEQGVNAQFGGLKEHALAYTKFVEEQPLFKGLRYSVWPASGQMFPKLRLKYKPNLISLAGGMSGLPITDPASRATPLEPAAWKQMISQALERKVTVLDIRNDYEWDAGHFVGAERPAEEVFHETPVGEEDADIPQPLRGVDKDAPIMMYCTGGIRCDVYSTFLKSKGFTNMYTLEGGIQNYLREEGPDHWNGSLYVFDGRMAIPAGIKSASCAESGVVADGAIELKAAVPCQICGTAVAQLPHMNCANIDCNELFIACADCKTKYNGCCCSQCMTAPRLLRPAKVSGGYYGQWGNYAEGEGLGQVMATGRSREGRVARRARRREAMKEKRAKQIEERNMRKQMMRQAMAQLEQLEQAQQEKTQEREGGAQEPARV
eukprot:CAMPEP_0202891242 /NCGR_PEP_ID=MMETSP1392-20130828/1356_1 /ASSEMBLY_ACC=CAM_ASM_000868 /TAXON_ID=225041 /ORGANISM="Chlamydomonas chlamydogama, Strain SAG 11-48b" /LENGTH=470 /DNA_ID=CAMNT_0049574937 /DNA_START=148 /DNA_END=1560 /DNA_ORIENTATION=+